MESITMSYKTTLMHCNDPRRLARLLAPTIVLADKFHSHVIGLSVVPPISVVTTGVIGASPIIFDAHCNQYRQENSAMRRQFDEATAPRSFSSEWRDEDAGSFPVIEVILEHARAADLVVASQTDRAWPGSERLDVAHLIAVESGRPVLIVPNASRLNRIGTRILLAWNGSREAARAAFDALPILKQAEATTIVQIEPETDEESEQSLGLHICDALLRHGVKCDETKRVTSQGGVGPTLITQAETLGADLLVMGCYGHSRLREFIFGGATRYLLEKMNLPVLMSH
jgi:nucleotide-binding universal stress UspA family protein